MRFTQCGVKTLTRVTGLGFLRDQCCQPTPNSASATPASASNQVREAWGPRPAPDEQSVRVVTVAFNPGEELERFLASLATATARRLVVVIADNGTEHDVVTAAAQRHGARVVGDGTNLG